MKKSRCILVFLVAALSLVSLPAMAEKKADTQLVKMEEITVTANKMEENIQKVPQSISVLNETEIEELGLKSSIDFLDQIPGMLSTPDHGVAVTFRGLKRSMFTENNPVVMYIDGVPVANSFGFDLSLVNIERIEVLRGPQGTIYGKDAIGGVINIITKVPDNTWHGIGCIEYSSWNTWYAQASANGPIIPDKLFVGLKGQYDKSDGWIKNKYPGMNEDLGRNDKHALGGYLMYTPTNRFRLRLGIDSWQDTSHNENGKAMPYDFMRTGDGYTSLSDFDRNMAENLELDIEGKLEMKVNTQDLSASYDFDRFKAESVTTHREREYNGLYDGDYSARSVFDGLVMFGDGELKTWTQELRLTSTNTTGFRWVGGLYLDKDEEQVVTGMQMAKEAMQSPVDMEIQSVSDTDAKTQAIFGQFMLPLGQSFELTLGGRYQRFNKKIHQDMYTIPVQGPFHANVKGMQPMFSQDLDKTWNTLLPKVAMAWFLSDRYTAYASFSKGYMPGGFNYFSMGGGPDENTFEPQKSTNYEIGIKSKHDSWRLNLTAFYMDIKDIHIYKTIGAMYVTDNADKAHSFGTELEGTWIPLKGLELSAGLSLMKAEYDDFDLGTVKLDGKEMEGSPNHNLRVGVSYHHPSGLYGRMNIRHVGNVHYYDDAVKKELQKEDAYTLVNMRLGWMYGNLDIYAFAKNLTDDKYINAFRSNAAMGGIAIFGDPRSIGVGLSYGF